MNSVALRSQTMNQRARHAFVSFRDPRTRDRREYASERRMERLRDRKTDAGGGGGKRKRESERERRLPGGRDVRFGPY